MLFVELHFLPLDVHGFDIDLEQAVKYLDDQELARYRRFKSDHAKKCFLQARRIVKTQLAKKLDCLPEDVKFAYSDTEKPFLIENKDWHFNISHSHSCVMVAICSSPVGVDVEDIDRCKSIWKNAESFLNSYVKACVDKANTDEEAAALFAEHWSCTESYIKLKGSAIYREKDRVKATPGSVFDGGKRYSFDGVQLTVFDFHESIRMTVAVEENIPHIDVVFWRTAEKKSFSPEILTV